VDAIDRIAGGPLSWQDIDYVGRHRLSAAGELAQSDESVGAALSDLRVELNGIVRDNTFREMSATEVNPTIDRDGALTRKKLALLGWEPSLIEDLIAALSGAASREDLGEDPLRFVQRNMRSFTIERFVAALPRASAIELPEVMGDRLYYDHET